MVDWVFSDTLVSYTDAEAQMEAHVADMIAGTAKERIWCLEHPPLYTAGTSADASDLIGPDRFPVFTSPRGGQYTYHGPGQRVVYTMLDLNMRGKDVRQFVQKLEYWVIATLGEFGITGHVRDGRVGVWVERPDKATLLDGAMREEKIAAIGIRLRKWISFHGISINIDPDLDHYAGIIPCGISGHGVTSFADLGLTFSMQDFDIVLQKTFHDIFESA
ncbi:MAG: lipoyl(octanoyl) transferase LipB [Pseudomonadota bacterium]